MKKTLGLSVFLIGLSLAGIFNLGSFAELDLEVKAPQSIDGDEALEKAGLLENARQYTEVIRPKVEYSSQDLRDPFQPFVEEKKAKVVPVVPVVVEPLPDLTVQGLIWGGAFPQAIINNKVVKIGDAIEGAQIESIDKDGVTVLFGGRQYKLSSPAVTGPQPKEKTQDKQSKEGA